MTTNILTVFVLNAIKLKFIMLIIVTVIPIMLGVVILAVIQYDNQNYHTQHNGNCCYDNQHNEC